MIIFVILLIILSFIALFIFIKSLLTLMRIKRAFRTGNVFVYGPKGRGKDVLFQTIINSRGKEYYANLDYGGAFNELNLKRDLELGSNTYETFIDDNIEIIDKIEDMEGKDIYISDGGVYFPSQMDSLLHKKYKSFPIFYALNRHLYNNGIHINCQCIERVWKALREQSDYFIKCRRCIKLPFFLIVCTTEYDKYQSALKGLLPLGGLIFNKYSKADKKKYKAENGFIKNGFIICRKKSCYYDSRAFHKKLFGYVAPRSKR